MKIEIECDQPLLSPFLRKKLNPLSFQLKGFKDIPAKSDPKFKPIYSTVKFVDDSIFKTREMPQQRDCRFMHEHVYLVGKENDPVALKERLATKTVKCYLHDNDEYRIDENEVLNYAIGLAQFTLRDFMLPNCKELKLRSEVFPCKRIGEDNTNELDINATARKQERPSDKLNPYLMNNTYCAIECYLAHPIRRFRPEQEL